MSSPSVVLAERIVRKLLAEQLVLSGDATRLQASLTDGTLTGQDWRLALDKALHAAARAAESES